MATFTNKKYGAIYRQQIKKAKSGNTMVCKVMHRISSSQCNFTRFTHVSNGYKFFQYFILHYELHSLQLFEIFETYLYQ